jgi:hypothetical protein
MAIKHAAAYGKEVSAEPIKRLVVAAILAVSCVGYSAPDPPSPRGATDVNASLGRTWDAVIDLFAARLIPIRTIERASGLIVTDQLRVGPEGREWADCGKTSAGRYRPNYATYNVLVRGDSTRASVKATVRWVYSDLKGKALDCSTTHVWEMALEQGVKTRAEEQKLAHASTTGPSAYASDVPSKSSSTTSVDLPSQRGAVEATQPSVTPVVGRTNAELLADPDFNRAIRDLRALRFLAGFQEGGPDTLLVDVSDKALSTNLSEYNLGHLFSAYYRMSNWYPRTIILFSNRGQVLGVYRRNGISVRQRR